MMYTLFNKLKKRSNAPQSRTLKLDLSSDNLPYLELVKLFKDIPSDVNQLELFNGYLHYKKALFALPDTVKLVRVTGDINIDLDALKSEYYDTLRIKYFKKELPILKKMEDKFLRSHNRKAYDAIQECRNELSELQDELDNLKIECIQFKKKSLQALYNAESKLSDSTRLNIKIILVNLALCIVGLGIGYTAYCLYRKTLFSYQPDAITKLKQLKTIINKLDGNYSLKPKLCEEYFLNGHSPYDTSSLTNHRFP